MWRDRNGYPNHQKVMKQVMHHAMHRTNIIYEAMTTAHVYFVHVFLSYKISTAACQQITTRAHPVILYNIII